MLIMVLKPLVVSEQLRSIDNDDAVFAQQAVPRNRFSH